MVTTPPSINNSNYLAINILFEQFDTRKKTHTHTHTHIFVFAQIVGPVSEHVIQPQF